jgi:hypothetical protein
MCKNKIVEKSDKGALSGINSLEELLQLMVC